MCVIAFGKWFAVNNSPKRTWRFLNHDNVCLALLTSFCGWFTSSEQAWCLFEGLVVGHLYHFYTEISILVYAHVIYMPFCFLSWCVRLNVTPGTGNSRNQHGGCRQYNSGFFLRYFPAVSLRALLEGRQIEIVRPQHRLLQRASWNLAGVGAKNSMSTPHHVSVTANHRLEKGWVF